jgi:hypothetical protein
MSSSPAALAALAKRVTILERRELERVREQQRRAMYPAAPAPASHIQKSASRVPCRRAGAIGDLPALSNCSHSLRRLQAYSKPPLHACFRRAAARASSLGTPRPTSYRSPK